MTAPARISVPLRRPLREPVGHTFTSVEGTVHGLSVTITLTNDELHILPHFSGAPATVNLIDLIRAVVDEMACAQFGPQEKR